MNAYNYVGGDPVNYVDPTETMTIDDIFRNTSTMALINGCTP